jgi:DNA modification methylase
MIKNGSRRDSFRRALAANGRPRRRPAPGQAKAETESSRSRRNDLLPPLRIETYPVGALKSHVRKLRKNDPAHIRDIAKSISRLGFNLPLLIGEDNLVVDGQARLEAAKLLGLASVPCIRVDHLDKTEQRLLRLAVNRLGEKGVWDLGELEAEFKELVIADAPIEISGFGADEVAQLIDEIHEPAREVIDLAPSAGPATARVGDLFRLGRHRLMCGDATDATVIRRLMGHDLARFVFTDGPFPLGIRGIEGEVNSLGDVATASDETTGPGFAEFHRKWIDAVLPYLMDGGLLGAFVDWRALPMVHASATALGLAPLDLIVCTKANGGPGDLYRSGHELLPLFKKGAARHLNNLSVGKRTRRRTNLWTYPTSASGSGARKSLSDHRSEKPIAMLEDALVDLTNRDDIVLDPFLGSGSTLIAAENSGCACYGVERDPLLIDVIIRRYEAATRTSAVLADTGETFATLAARRLLAGRL